MVIVGYNMFDIAVNYDIDTIIKKSNNILNNLNELYKKAIYHNVVNFIDIRNLLYYLIESYKDSKNELYLEYFIPYINYIYKSNNNINNLQIIDLEKESLQKYSIYIYRFILVIILVKCIIYFFVYKIQKNILINI